MNLARPAGFVPAGPASLPLKFSRGALLACAGVLASLNAQAGLLINDRTYQSLGSEIRDAAGISAVVWLALFVVLQVGLEARAQVAGRRDQLIAAIVLGLCLLPFAFAAKLGLLVCALYAFWTSRPGEPARRVAIILLSLTGTLIWGPLILTLFAAPLLSLDAHLVAAAIGSSVDGNIVAFATGGRQFLIGVPCSSVHNMSLALVLWTTAAAAFRVRFDALYIVTGVAMVATMFVLNIVRLSLIGLYPRSFSFLHDGLGADLFAWGGLLAACALAFVGVDRAVRRQQ